MMTRTKHDDKKNNMVGTCMKVAVWSISISTQKSSLWGLKMILALILWRHWWHWLWRWWKWWQCRWWRTLVYIPGTLPGSKIQAGCPQVASIRGHLCQDEDVNDNADGIFVREPVKNYSADFPLKGEVPPIFAKGKSAKNPSKNANFSPFWPIFVVTFLAIFC